MTILGSGLLPGPATGASLFTDLTDTPVSITADALVVGNGTGTALVFATAASLGFVIGPASATDNAVARYDTTTGKLIQDSVVTIDDAGVVSGASISDDQITIQTAGGSPSYTDLRDFSKVSTSSGVISGGVMSDGGSGTLDITAAEVLIRSSNSATGEIHSANVPAATGLALTDNSINYIYAEYNAGTPQYVAYTTYQADEYSNVIIGIVYRNGTELHITNSTTPPNQVSQLLGKRLSFVDGVTRQSGSITSETGTRNIAITAGDWWLALDEYIIPAVDTSASDTFIYYYQDGLGGWTAVTGSTQIDNLQYDDGSGTLATLGNGRYGVHWVYRGIDGDTCVIYGTDSYTFATAQAATTPVSLPPQMTAFHTLLVARIIIRKSESTFTEIATPFDVTFIPGVPTDHNELSNLQGGTTDEYYHLTATQHTDLTDAGDSALHYHATDRDRANHTGTQLASTISDFDTEVSNNTDVAANTAARHDAVTVADTASIDLTLTGQQVSGIVLPAGVDHDALNNFVTNEHIDHSSVTLTAGEGLTGGGDITTNRTFALDVNGLTEDSAVASGDFFVYYDTVAGDHKKINFDDMPSGGGGGGGDPQAGVIYGAVSAISANNTEEGAMGQSGALGVGVCLPFDAEIYALTITLTQDRTSGTATGQFALDDTWDTTNTVVINSAADTAVADFTSSTIPVTAGDEIRVRIVSASLTPNGSGQDGTVAVYWRVAGSGGGGGGGGVSENTDVQFSELSANPTSTTTNPIASTIVTPAATNLVTNPNIETNTTGWSTYGLGTVALTRVNTDAAGYGTWSLEVNLTSNTANSGAVITASVGSNKVYYVSGFVKNISGGTNYKMQLDGNVGTAATFAAFTRTDEFVHIEGWYTTTTDTTLDIRFASNSAAASKHLIDLVMCVEVDAVGTRIPYFDGSIASSKIVAWSGTAHNSTSTIDAGTHHIAPMVIPAGGEMGGGGFYHNADGSFGPVTFSAAHAQDVQSPWTFYGDMRTVNNVTALSDDLHGVVHIINEGNGTALQVRSEVTTDVGVGIALPSITSGTGLSITVEDKDTFITGGGDYFAFADKQQLGDYTFNPTYIAIGALKETLDKAIKMRGAGSVDSRNAVAKTGTASRSLSAVTSADASTLFTSEFAVGDIIQIGTVLATIRSITDDHNLNTVEGNSLANAAVSRMPDLYSAPRIALEAPGARHPLVNGFDGLAGCYYFGEGAIPRYKRPVRITGRTATATINTTAVTLSSSSSVFAGSWIAIDGVGFYEVTSVSGSVVHTRYPVDSTVSAGTPCTIFTVNGTSIVKPTSETDSETYFLNHKNTFSDTKSMGTFTAATSIFTTLPVILADGLSNGKTVRIEAWGTISGAGKMKLSMKYGGTTFCVGQFEPTHVAGAGTWKLNAIINGDGSTGVTCGVEMRKQVTSGGAVEGEIFYATDCTNTGESAVDNTLCGHLDILFESTNGTSFTATCYAANVTME